MSTLDDINNLQMLHGKDWIKHAPWYDPHGRDRVVEVPFKLWDKLRSQSMTLESNLYSPDERVEDPRFKGTSMRLTFSEQDFKEVKEINKMIRNFQKG